MTESAISQNAADGRGFERASCPRRESANWVQDRARSLRTEPLLNGEATPLLRMPRSTRLAMGRTGLEPSTDGL
jgi:hypothetical protein